MARDRAVATRPDYPLPTTAGSRQIHVGERKAELHDDLILPTLDRVIRHDEIVARD